MKKYNNKEVCCLLSRKDRTGYYNMPVNKNKEMRLLKDKKK